VAALLVGEMGVILWGYYSGSNNMFPPETPPAGYSNVKELGRLIYTEYVYPFELAAVILLVAIVAAIALTLRQRKATKYLDPSRQVKVRRADRVRLVSMPSEKPVQAGTDEGEGA